jgi:hypothetical protein
LHQNRKLGKKKTPKTVVVSGFFDNCRKAVIISSRTVRALRKQSCGLFLARHGESYAFASLGTRRDNKNGTHQKMDAI